MSRLDSSCCRLQATHQNSLRAARAPPRHHRRPLPARTALGASSSNNTNRLVGARCLPAGGGHNPADEFLQALRAPSGLQQSKCFVFVRHGHSTWNDQSRIQGNTDLSELTETGRLQALRARAALQEMTFDSCFSSPHTRARQTTELVWQPWLFGASLIEPQYLPSLSEVDLGWFQGLRNEDIARDHPDLYRVWREEPERFELSGRFPVLDAFRQSRRAWHDMLASPGCRHLVITHKSLLRALLCTAIGLPPRQFRAIDIANGAVCMVRSNARGDMRFTALNLTSHLLYDDVRYHMPPMDANDVLAAGTTAAGAPVYTPVHVQHRSSSSSSSSNNNSGDGGNTGGFLL